MVIIILMIFVGGLWLAIYEHNDDISKHNADMHKIAGKYYGTTDHDYLNEMDFDKTDSSIVYSYSNDSYAVITLLLTYKIKDNHITFYYGNKSGTLTGKPVKTNDVIAKGKIISKDKIIITDKKYDVLVNSYTTTKNIHAKNDN